MLFGKQEIRLYRQQLKKGDNGYNKNLNELYQYNENDNENRMTDGHYITITAVIKDDITTNNKIMLKVSSWGKTFYLNYDEYREYIEDESGTWTSSMVYIR